MKTLEKKLKKYVLIVDENDFEYYELFKEGIYFKLENGDRDFIEGEFEFICKGSELTEEIASKLVENYERNFYVDYNAPFHCGYCFTANDALISAVESKEKFWLENPMPPYIPVIDKKADENYMKKYFEAEEKTFKNPLIFVKK